MAKNPLSRRQFIHLGTGAIAATTVAKNILQPHLLFAAPRPVAPSDTVRFASIGTGIRGCEHLQASLSVPGIQCVAVCDLYDSRHTAAQEAVQNPSVAATRDYRTILDRKDVDSVLIATMDHNHRQIFLDACAAGKDVYCEKPMSHTVEDGFAMVEAAQKNKRMVAIGSQRVSSVLYAKAKVAALETSMDLFLSTARRTASFNDIAASCAPTGRPSSRISSIRFISF